ncbi:hypothetical protein BU14_0202s0002 [Porphyra umbilicalis]|uniref:CCT-alpha n=1 Tax=Porphyra umbilicalis TaxID=2786 RepID=A0A1X6P646_PORUM|nr:hypothetical protein BU14_0202s0002 [Porphyra umbilicalis]|eukprot:OSX76215.1 hypothetical protein BU14_0202s0002 [Porphyra umbilicalis]
MTSLAISGHRESGQDVRTANVTACVAVANILRSSLGPQGLDKMLVDEVGDVTVTNDGATIVGLLEVEHPAARILTELAQQQDQEVGDGTTSVVILAAELLKRANDLVADKIHPTNIIAGYRLAIREACKYVRDHMATPVEALGRELLVNAAATSLSSKILGSAESNHFANMAVDAVLSVKTGGVKGGPPASYPIKAVHVLKCQGQSARESELLPGVALNCGRAAKGMPSRVSPARVACLDVDLRRTKMKMGVQVQIDDASALNAAQEKELDITRDRVQAILASGANVILTTKGIDDAALKYFVEAGAIALRRVPMEDVRRVAKATGAVVQGSLADLDGNESLDSSQLGAAEEAAEMRIRDDTVTVLRGCQSTAACSVLLRGPNEYMCDEMGRSFHDAVCVVKRTLESGTVVPGGGAVEAALSVHLDQYATTLGTREMLAVAQVADALLVIPKTLAVNAAMDATDLVARLRAAHYMSQNEKGKEELALTGLDLKTGVVRNSSKAGVVEPALSKIKSIQFAAEAAITILRIDDSINVERKDADPEG